jgi:hypothetical protein
MLREKKSLQVFKYIKNHNTLTEGCVRGFIG